MASSQVEIATSSPFVHARRESCLNRSHIDITDLWVHRPQWQAPTEDECDNNNNNNNPNNNDKPKSDKWAKAREMVFSVEGAGSSVEDSNNSGGGDHVSSLVEKWRGFEAKRGSNASSTNTIVQTDNIFAPGVDPPFTPTPSPPPSLCEDVDSLLGDWEPDRTAFGGLPCSRSRDSSAMEIEKIRVADIIKRLTVNDVVSESSSRSSRILPSSSSQSDQQRCPFPVVNTSPCIRGRQAFNDLLVQIYRDRHKELEWIVARKPVSRFSHRGRIKALLRFRFLRPGMEGKHDHRHSNVHSTHTHHKTIRHPGVMHIRERAKPKSAQEGSAGSAERGHKELVDNTGTSQNEVTDSERCPEIKTDKTNEPEVPATSKQKHDDVGQGSNEVKEDTEANGRLCHSYEAIGHEANPFSTLIRKDANWENNNHKQLAKSAEIDPAEEFSTQTIETTSIQNKEEENTNHNQLTVNSSEELPTYHKGEPTQDLVDTNSMCWVSDNISNPDVEWDGLQYDNRHDQEQEGSHREWIEQVARPRSDWEGLRQERYQEMLDPFLDNEEIRVLLGRRSVSTFLSSSMRDKIDQMMASRAQGRQILKTDETQVKEKREIRLCVQVGASDEQYKRIDYNDITFDEYEANERSAGQLYNNDESDDYTDRITRTSSWPRNQESIDYSYHHQIASPSTQQSPNNFSQNSSRRPESVHSSAIDMELIYDLRGHMEQLHQEMSELRKSIKCCVDVQINLQQSIKKEVQTALHGGYLEAKSGQQNAAKKATSPTSGSTGGICCVCCKMQVDSLLYRCGHMCTCFNCAHELHWSSGKCPICSAPILDVVRTCSNNS